MDENLLGYRGVFFHIFLRRGGGRDRVREHQGSPIGHEGGLDHEHGLSHRLLVEVQAAVRSFIRAVAEDLPTASTLKLSC